MAFPTSYDNAREHPYVVFTGRAVWHFAVPAVTTAVFWFIWTLVIRIISLRRFYERQGIPFVITYPFLGAEWQVSKLQAKNKSHDWLYTDRTSDLYGTVRGLRVQLYGTSAECCERLTAHIGREIERDTPSLYSFGRLSPGAFTFLRTTAGRFKERKLVLTRAISDNTRVFRIATERAEEAMAFFNACNGSGARVNIRDLLDLWTPVTIGESVWGKDNISRDVEYYDENGVMTSLPSMLALKHTFTRLRAYALVFWNRVYHPFAALPFTKEARCLNYNVRVLRKTMEDMMRSPDSTSVAAHIQKMHEAQGLPYCSTLDDLADISFAGLDALQSIVMTALFQLWKPENASWKQQIFAEGEELKARVEHASNPASHAHARLSHRPKLSAFIHEALRYEPPGSLINNVCIKDFDLSVGGKSYAIKSKTRIMTSVHALHHNEDSWKDEIADNMSPLSKFDPNRFLAHSDDVTRS